MEKISVQLLAMGLKLVHLFQMFICNDERTMFLFKSLYLFGNGFVFSLFKINMIFKFCCFFFKYLVVFINNIIHVYINIHSCGNYT